jgi:hypothetical protein
LRYLLPTCLLPVETDRVHLLDLNDALAPAAGNPKDMLRDLAEAQGRARTCCIRCADIIEKSVPILVRHLVVRPKGRLSWGLSTH